MENRKPFFKYLSILFSVLLPLFFAGSALADEGGTAISAGDTAWLLTSSALVLAMIHSWPGSLLRRDGTR